MILDTKMARITLLIITILSGGMRGCAFQNPLQSFLRLTQHHGGFRGATNEDSGNEYDSFTDGYNRSLQKKNSFLRQLFRRVRIDPGRAYHERMRQQEFEKYWAMMVGKMDRLFLFRHRGGKARTTGSLILVRHGESYGARHETFLGWADPDLTQHGKREAEHAARLIREAGYEIHVVFTSRLQRAIHSTWIMLRELEETYLPVFKDWRLNERSYGALTGLNKAEVAESMGVAAAYKWQRDPRAVPPPLATSDPRWPGQDRRYADIAKKKLIPVSESLCDCIDRVGPLWANRIKTELEAGHNVLVVGHGSTLRGMIKHIQDLDDDVAQSVRIPPGSPIVYEFDKQMRVQQTKGGASVIGQQEGLTGTFLDKPGLLEKALEREDEWKHQILHEETPNTAEPNRQLTSFEASLARLQADRELEEWVDETNGKDKSIGIFQSMYSSSALAAVKGNDTVVNYAGRSGSDVEPFVISGHPCLAPLPNGVSMPDKIQLPGRKGAVIVMVRHGNTEHNKLGLFTGWEDPPLTKEGAQEAQEAGRLLQANGFEFDVVYTSWLFRAIETAWHIMDMLGSTWLPVVKSWRLNERHYGKLTGKSKQMTSRVFGEEQLKQWRRGYKVKPPPVNSFSVDYPGNDRRYRTFLTDLPYSVSESIIRTVGRRKLTLSRNFPKTESLHCCMKRTIPYFRKNIVPEAIDKGKRVLIASSENAIRGLLMHLCDIPEAAIPDINVPNGVPLIYDVKSRTIRLLDDGSGIHPLLKHNFGPAAKYLFQSGDTDYDMEDEECDISSLSDETWSALSAAFSSAGSSMPKV